VSTVTSAAAFRPRAFVRVKGPDAEDFLQRMVSNDVTQGEFFDALLLTAKARLVAPLRVWRRGADDFLLLTEPELGEAVRTTLLRARFAAKCEIELEEHTSTIVLGGQGGIPSPDYGVPATELLDAPSDKVSLGVEDRPLLGQVLARRQARGVVTRVGHLLLRF